MKLVRFLMIGGFLGAGKTTAIGRIARHYTDRGLKVGIVTNDQAYDLVDTHSLRAQGFDVGEVPGACFCCKFNDLIETVGGLSKSNQPDLILAEPVGSCTDLVATVIEPLRQLYGEQYEISPLAVLLKPEHGAKILGQQARAGFSPKAEYIFLKQIEEADVVAVNKSDKLSKQERESLMQQLETRLPGTETYCISAATGEGFDAFLAALERAPSIHHSFMDVDYDTYAEGEAELGWLNCQVRLRSPGQDRFELDPMLLDLVREIRQQLARLPAEPAHLKVLGQAADAPQTETGQEKEKPSTDTAIANLVDSQGEVELSIASAARVRAADLIVNARVATSPDALEQVVRASVEQMAGRHHLEVEIAAMQRFRPGRPVPTHRMS